MNTELLVSDTRHYRIDYEINPYMCTAVQPDPASAAAEHATIVAAHRAAGRIIHFISAAPECPDMVYTAIAALVRGDRAVLGSPPPQQRPRSPTSEPGCRRTVIEVLDAPYAFSGQGDALPCGDLLLAGHGQRTDRRMHAVLADHLGYDILALRTSGPQWYDLDLAVAVIHNPHTIAYCPAALDRPSRSAPTTSAST